MDLLFKQIDQKHEILYCQDHQHIQENGGKNVFPKQRFPKLQNQSESRNTFMNVLYETYKCQICENISGQLIKCQHCEAIYCKNCPFAHKDKRWATISFLEQKCIKCYNQFFNEKQIIQISEFKGLEYLLFLDSFDNYKIDNKRIQELHKDFEINKEIIKNMNVDRNIQQILNEDMQVSCQFSDCEDCKIKTGSLQKIMLHQTQCKACENCQYLCPIKDKNKCECNQYYSKEMLSQHLSLFEEPQKNQINHTFVSENDQIKVEQQIDENQNDFLQPLLPNQQLQNQEVLNNNLLDELLLNQVLPNEVVPNEMLPIEFLNQNLDLIRIREQEREQRNRRSICKSVCKFICKCLRILFYPITEYLRLVNHEFQQIDQGILRRKLNLATYAIDNLTLLSLYILLLFSVYEFKTKSQLNFKDSNQNKNLGDRAILAYQWYIFIIIGFLSVCCVMVSTFVMIIVITRKINGQANLIGIFKIILIAFVFAPFQIDLIGYSLLLGINGLNRESKRIFLYFNFYFRPFCLALFYIFFIPIQSFLFSQVENKNQMPITIITLALYPLIMIKNSCNMAYYMD